MPIIAIVGAGLIGRSWATVFARGGWDVRVTDPSAETLAAAPGLIRVTRGETLALREEDYVRAAIANGAGDATILCRHIVPNMTSTLLVQMTVTIPAAIIGEAVLSFLGLGVQPPTPSWGVMLADAQSYLSQAPRLAVYPGLAIFLCSLSFNLLGDGLRDVLDPRTTR